MKSLMVHYKNKYPNGRVSFAESGLDVFSESGEHVVALRKNGADQLVDVSESYGLRDRHDLAPIPKDSRVHKVVGGKIGLSEEHAERKELVKDFLCPKHNDRVMSCDEASQYGLRFDKSQNLVK